MKLIKQFKDFDKNTKSINENAERMPSLDEVRFYFRNYTRDKGDLDTFITALKKYVDDRRIDITELQKHLSVFATLYSGVNLGFIKKLVSLFGIDFIGIRRFILIKHIIEREDMDLLKFLIGKLSTEDIERNLYDFIMFAKTSIEPNTDIIDYLESLR